MANMVKINYGLFGIKSIQIFNMNNMNNEKIINRLTELIEAYTAKNITSFLDEAFENHLRATSNTGPPLANNYFVLCELKAIISEADQKVVNKF